SEQPFFDLRAPAGGVGRPPRGRRAAGRIVGDVSVIHEHVVILGPQVRSAQGRRLTNFPLPSPRAGPVPSQALAPRDTRFGVLEYCMDLGQLSNYRPCQLSSRPGRWKLSSHRPSSESTFRVGALERTAISAQWIETKAVCPR